MKIIAWRGLRVVIGVLLLLAVGCRPRDGAAAGPAAVEAEGGAKNDRSQVVLVNVGGAVPDEVFERAVAELRRASSFNYRIRDLQAVDPGLLSREGRTEISRLAGPDVCVAVFVTGDADGAGLLSQPGCWSLINARLMRHDQPDEARYEKRVLKLLMKGVGYAAGIGANPDPRCVMYHKSFSLDGIDATSASYGPYAMVPLMDTLRDLSDGAVFKDSSGE
jgi:hypothetical protein